MGGEVFQAQVIRNFFDTITGTDRNLTRVHMCVLSLAKLRMESPEKMASLHEQLRMSRQKRELSIDILDYVCDAAIDINLNAVQTAFGVKEISEMQDQFSGVSMDSF